VGATAGLPVTSVGIREPAPPVERLDGALPGRRTGGHHWRRPAVKYMRLIYRNPDSREPFSGPPGTELIGSWTATLSSAPAEIAMRWPDARFLRWRYG
jgi:hypothetical protein